MSRTRLATELYLVCSRCAWHARRVQRERPTQRGMLTGHIRGCQTSPDVTAAVALWRSWRTWYEP